MTQEVAKVASNDSKSVSNKDKRTGVRIKAMNAVVEAQSLFRQAFPAKRYGKVESAFYEAVRFISPRVEKEFTIRRARSIHEGTAKRIDSEEMDALRAAKVEELRREYRETRSRLQELGSALSALDEGMGG